MNESIDIKLINEEYINYVDIVRKFENVPFVEKKTKSKVFKILQHLLEDRIMYRYSINEPPYHGYNKIDSKEMEIINEFFNNTKQYFENTNKKNDLYYNLDKIKDYFISTINNIDKSQLSKHHRIEQTYDHVRYGRIIIKLDNRLRLLLKMSNVHIFVRFILRYIGYGITGQHCSIPFDVYKYLYDNLNIKGEGFSSPLNSKLLGLPETVFCTLFEDTDKYFGSLGPFSSDKIIKHSEKNWLLNPPYIESILYYAYEHSLTALDKITRDDFMIIYMMPKWEDSEVYTGFKQSKYLVDCIEPDVGKHYMNCNGNMVHMTGVVNVMFFLSRNKNVINQNQINTIKKIWNQKTLDLNNQSSFSSPEMSDE